MNDDESESSGEEAEFTGDTEDNEASASDAYGDDDEDGGSPGEADEDDGEEDEGEDADEEEYAEEDDDDDDGDDDGDDDEAYVDDDDDEDVPLSSLKLTNGKRPAPSSGDDDGESSDDDDVPLASLAKKAKPSPAARQPKTNNGTTSKKKASTSTAAKKKKEAAAKKKKATSKTASKKKDTSASSSAAASNGEYEWPSAALYGSECTKGLLIQRLLCRWWYAITWPDPSCVKTKPPKHYDTLDGFPGVYVCSSGDKVGQLRDMRTKDDCPSFRNFARKSSDELKTLLLKALDEQKKQLQSVEGTAAEAAGSVHKEVNDMIKWATKVNPDKADREAVKVLKAARLELP